MVRAETPLMVNIRVKQPNSAEPVCYAGDTKLGVQLKSVSVVQKGPRKALILYTMICCIECIVCSTVCVGHWLEWSRGLCGLCVPETHVGIRDLPL